MVYLKLMAMGLLKKAHSEFTRQGATLYQKYDGKLQTHYLAINNGEQIGFTRIKF